MSGRERAFNLPPVVVWSAAVLLVIHVVRGFPSPEIDFSLLLTFAFIPARYGEAGAILPGGVAAQLWTPVTYALLHADALHLAVNLFWMAGFGSAIARRFRTSRFLLLCALGAVAGAAAQYVADPADEALMIGASAAVSGMMAATARFAFAPGGPLAGGGTLPAAYAVPALGLAATFLNARAALFLGVWMGVNLLFGFEGALLPGVEGAIAWQAHIGGFLAGLFGFALLDPARTGTREVDLRD